MSLGWPRRISRAVGAGLGLYVTKQLVEKNRGKISVKSKLGEGAKFTLSLPSK